MKIQKFSVTKSFMGKHRVVFDCPGCHECLRCALNDAGKDDSCPGCQIRFIVPGKNELEAFQLSERSAAEAKLKKKKAKTNAKKNSSQAESTTPTLGVRCWSCEEKTVVSKQCGRCGKAGWDGTKEGFFCRNCKYGFKLVTCRHCGAENAMSTQGYVEGDELNGCLGLILFIAIVVLLALAKFL
jgi:hypothetical protein